MTLKEFIETVFRGIVGVNVELSAAPVPQLRFVEQVNECDLECGTDPNSYYAIDTFSFCPRAYMIKYLAKRPLSIPFYAQVQEIVRETVCEYAAGRLKPEEIGPYFERR